MILKYNHKLKYFVLKIMILMVIISISNIVLGNEVIAKNIKKGEKMTKKYKELTQEEKNVIINKGTERAFTGKYNNYQKKGTYNCKQCGNPLFTSDSKFKSGSGWPSFDDSIKGAVKKILDKDGHRVEIVCAKCGAHLGHVFEGEKFTEKNTRNCVNSISLEFTEKLSSTPLYKKAYFAGGCFWGVEYHFEKLNGVISAISGYMGGDLDNPTYRDVCTKDTGHLEVVEVNYDPSIVSFKELTKLFFEIHDPTQVNGQGPDIGEQYLSAIFYNNESEKKEIEELINILEKKGYKIATKARKKEFFYEAEEYHQDYYQKHNKKPYCHSYTKRF